MSVDERPGASDSPTPATYALGRDTAEAERLRRQTTELQPLAAELLDRVGAGGRYAADGDGPDSAELGAISASTLAVCPPRRRPSPLHYRRVDGAGTPTLPVDYLAKVPLWGARSGLKMAWWSPCDVVGPWFFEAVI
jgi:hypothetical protein